MKKAYHGALILPDKILPDGYLLVEDEKIVYLGTDRPLAKTYHEVDGYIAPGFVDIHCHDCPAVSGYEDPVQVAEYHFGHGTTSMLLTLYRGETHEKYLSLIDQIKTNLPNMKNVKGIHMEGPYLNGRYGAQTKAQDYPVPEEYRQYLASGLIKQWTCSPEVSGSIDLIREIKACGVVPAIGHSEASYNQVKEAVEAGAKIATHLFDATGTTPDGKAYLGTHDVSFDEACMLFDMYYEVICDSGWIHLRKAMLQLLVKTVGIDRIVAITDCCTDTVGDDLDINIIDGEIMGSKMTMDRVAFNLRRAGYSMPEIAKMTSGNPARAIKLDDCGEIAEGMRADLIEVDKEYRFVQHLS